MAPALALALLVIAFSGLAFHALFGRALADLPLWMLLALVGFTLGEAAARMLGLPPALGEVHLPQALAGAWLLMGLARWRWRRRA